MKPLFLLSLLLLSLAVFSAEIKGKVVAVSDGDTITVLDEMDKGNFKIRLDKIDAPEKKQPFGSKAKQFLSSLIFGKQVTVRFKAVDRYGRIVGVVYCDEVEINLLMVQNGYAWHYSHYDKTPAYINAEKLARANKKGLWADHAPVNPYKFHSCLIKRQRTAASRGQSRALPRSLLGSSTAVHSPRFLLAKHDIATRSIRRLYHPVLNTALKGGAACRHARFACAKQI